MALQRFEAESAHEILELGSGQGRDTVFLAAAGMVVTALDYAEEGLAQIIATATAAGVGNHVTAVTADVRDPLPLPDASFDACYSHMLLCMALTTPDLERLVAEVCRVVRPGGLCVYTVRNTADAHFEAGVSHGDDLWEMGGFIVHFFDRTLIDRLAGGFEILEVAEYQEGNLPRRLFAVTMRKRSDEA